MIEIIIISTIIIIMIEIIIISTIIIIIIKPVKRHFI